MLAFFEKIDNLPFKHYLAILAALVLFIFVMALQISPAGWLVFYTMAGLFSVEIFVAYYNRSVANRIAGKVAFCAAGLSLALVFSLPFLFVPHFRTKQRSLQPIGVLTLQ
ncbi:hypothetical protein IH992_04785 [Candidatus Poribacteria bacterium]|nr:hypothetical protein [Candidatus Poribacteria bacterium]